MSCDDNVCGTGGYTGPKPGDPDNNVTLSATSVHGGITVNWSWPTINGNAVAHTLLYRGTVNDLSKAVQVGVVGGSIYYDKLDPVQDTVYFYWIRLVSINGTVGDVIGPVSATAHPLGQQTLATLTGLIDAGLLAQSLKTEIARIPALNFDIAQEVQDRLNSNTLLSTALSHVQDSLGTALTYVDQEIQQRKDADSALVDSIRVIAAGVAGNTSAIAEEQIVRAGKDSAMASDILAITSIVGDNQAGLIHDIGTMADQVSAVAHDVTMLTATVGDAGSGIIHDLNVTTSTANTANQTASTAATDIQRMSSVIGDANSGLIKQLNTVASTAKTAADDYTQLSATLGDANSGLIHDLNVVTTRANTTATDMTTVQSTLNGNTASGQVGLTTQVTNLDGKVTAIGALYTAKVEVNGLIGGFGVYNDGTSVEAGFDVDRFWIGRTYNNGTNAVKPFIVDNDTVYIDKARIRNADIDSLKIAGSAVTVPITARTNNVVSGSGLTNWKQIIAGYIKLDQPGIVYAHCICFQTYGQGIRKWQMRISINGTVGSSIGGQSVIDTPVIAQSLGCPAGVIPIIVEWSGENDGVRIQTADLFIIGAKR